MQKIKVTYPIQWILGLCLVTIIFISCMSQADLSDNEIQSYLKDLPFEMGELKAPTFPNRTVNIIDHGAVGDGHTMNTDAIAAAINTCAEAGGGKVLLPSGIWLTGPIELKSNINLHVSEGAVILFSDKFEDYPLIETSFEGRPEIRSMSPISGRNLENIAITGKGVIDGSGGVWRPVKKFKMTDWQWRGLIASGGVLNQRKDIWWPTEAALNAGRIMSKLADKDAPLEDYKVVRSFLRPVMVSLVECKNVLLDGPTFQNSPAWNIHPLMCENLILRNLTVLNPWFSQNGDGLDLESCKNALVYKCRFDVGDDALCMKSGRDKAGRDRGMPTENVVIADCIVYHGHGGFVVGSEMSGGVRNLMVRDCIFWGTDVGLRFKSTRGRGGVVENIYIQDILMKDIPTDALRFNMYYANQVPIPDDGYEDKAGKQFRRPFVPVNEETPSFRKIYMKNIVCRGAARAVLLQGLPEMPIQDIYFENIKMTADVGVACLDADRISFMNVDIVPEKGPVFSMDDTRNVVLENISLPDQPETFISLVGEQTENIQINTETFNQIQNRIKMTEDVNKNALVEK